MNQSIMYYAEVRKAGERDALFLDLVRDGMTARELRRLIEKRPDLWGRYAAWIDKLPTGEPADA